MGKFFSIGVLLFFSGFAGAKALPVCSPFRWELSSYKHSNAKAGDLYDIDGYVTSPIQVSALKAKGVIPICYINIGAHERDRQNPEEIILARNKVAPYPGWNEDYVDIRRIEVQQAMQARIRMCARKGFMGVEFDNMDMYGMSRNMISHSFQLKFNREMAKYARSLGLKVLHKNTSEMVSALEPYFDMALVESCFSETLRNGDPECEHYSKYRKAGKPVALVEYYKGGIRNDDQGSYLVNAQEFKKFCDYAGRKGFTGVVKTKELTSKIVHSCAAPVACGGK